MKVLQCRLLILCIIGCLRLCCLFLLCDMGGAVCFWCGVVDGCLYLGVVLEWHAAVMSVVAA